MADRHLNAQHTTSVQLYSTTEGRATHHPWYGELDTQSAASKRETKFQYWISLRVWLVRGRKGPKPAAAPTR